MRNFKDKVIDTLSNALIVPATTDSPQPELPTVRVVSDYPQSPEDLPCVMVRVIRQSADMGSYDERSKAPRYNVSIQVDMYTVGKDAPIKVEALFEKVDAAMQGMKFVLEDYAPTNNIDRTISRGVARYSAVVEPHYGVSDTKYQIFRR